MPSLFRKCFNCLFPPRRDPHGTRYEEPDTSMNSGFSGPPSPPTPDIKADEKKPGSPPRRQGFGPPS